MGTHQVVRDRLRERLRDEREHRGWSMSELAQRIARHEVFGWYPSTVAKIETGERAVQVHELLALADLFELSVDALLGRRSDVSDVLWATSRLSSNAQKMAGEVEALQRRIAGDLKELVDYADREHKRGSIESLIKFTNQAHDLLRQTCEALRTLASEFPLPGMKLERAESKPAPQ